MKNKGVLRWILVIFFTIVFSTAIIQVKNFIWPKTSEFEIYEDKASKFAINPPEDWGVADITFGEAPNIVRGKAFSPDSGRSMIAVVLIPIEKSDPAIEEVGAYVKSLASKDTSGYQVLSDDGGIVFSGHQAYRFEYVSVDKKVKNHRKIIAVLSGKNIFLITLMAPDSKWKTFEPVASKSADTFKIR